MKYLIALFCFLFLLIFTTCAQVAINKSGDNPDPSAMLDVQSDSLGFLIPRITCHNLKTMVAPATGLMVYQVDNNAGLYINTGTPASPSWMCIEPSSQWAYSSVSQTLHPGSNSYNLGIGTNNASRQLTLTGSIEMPSTNGSDAGVIYKNGNSFFHDFSAGSADGFNTFAGELAGNFTASGASSYQASRNTAFGYSTLYNVSTGYRNTAMGYNTLVNLTTGYLNTVIGSDAGYNITTGKYNTGLGRGALYGSAGSDASYNVALGYYAGRYLDAGGNHNILIGYQAGDNIYTGSGNIIIGDDLNAPVGNANDQLYIGGLVYGDLAQGKFGINTTAPTSELHIYNGSGNCTSVIESNSGRPVLKLNGATGLAEITFEQNSIYKAGMGYNYTNDNLFFYHGGNMIFKNGRLGIGETNPTDGLHVMGNAKLQSASGAPQFYFDGTTGKERLNFRESGTDKASVGYDIDNEYTFINDADGDEVKIKDGNLIVDGEFKYNEPRTFYFNFTGCDLQISHNAWIGYVNYMTSDCSMRSEFIDDGQGYFHATGKFHLPDSAKITKFTIRFQQLQQMEVTVKVTRSSFTTSLVNNLVNETFTYNATPSGQFTSVHIPPSYYSVIDNQDYTYIVHIHADNLVSYPGCVFWFSGISIEYTLDRVSF